MSDCEVASSNDDSTPTDVRSFARARDHRLTQWAHVQMSWLAVRVVMLGSGCGEAVAPATVTGTTSG